MWRPLIVPVDGWPKLILVIWCGMAEWILEAWRVPDFPTSDCFATGAVEPFRRGLACRWSQ